MTYIPDHMSQLYCANAAKKASRKRSSQRVLPRKGGCCFDCLFSGVEEIDKQRTDIYSPSVPKTAGQGFELTTTCPFPITECLRFLVGYTPGFPHSPFIAGDLPFGSIIESKCSVVADGLVDGAAQTQVRFLAAQRCTTKNGTVIETPALCPHDVRPT